MPSQRNRQARNKKAPRESLAWELQCLLRDKFWTARALSVRLKVSRLWVYRHLRAFHALDERRVRERPTGPLATAYRLQR